MNNLQQDFLRQSVLELENLSKKLSAENVSENLLREAFRQIHTIKGTSQTFGFSKPSHLAHELENLLQTVRENKNLKDKNFILLLQEGIRFLSENLQAAGGAKQSADSQDFVKRIKSITKTASQAKKSSLLLPPDVLPQLSQREKDSLCSAIENGFNLFQIEVAFDFVNFESEFKKFKNVLDKAGEVVATFPSSKFSGRLGFQFFLTTEKNTDEISQVILPFEAEIIYKTENDQPISVQVEVKEMLQQATDGAQRLAKQLGKEVALDVSVETESENSVKHLKIIFDILLHLIRNAIDHGIEERGKIEIVLNEEGNNLRLIFSDDGKGIDLEKIKAKAVERNLIPDGKILTEAEILDLIFLPEFTTASDITEISGRGVGLDAVKNAVENANGTISVKSERDFGTTFEIILPYEK